MAKRNQDRKVNHKENKYRLHVFLVLSILVMIACTMDLFTFWQYENVRAAESNPVILFLVSHSVPIPYLSFSIFKVAVNLFLVYLLLTCGALSPFKQYFYFFIILWIIFAQFMGAWANHDVATRLIAKYPEYHTVDQIPKEVIATHIPPPDQQVSYYLKLMQSIMLLPAIFGLLAFKLWELSYFPQR